MKNVEIEVEVEQFGCLPLVSRKLLRSWYGIHWPMLLQHRLVVLSRKSDAAKRFSDLVLNKHNTLYFPTANTMIGPTLVALPCTLNGPYQVSSGGLSEYTVEQPYSLHPALAPIFFKNEGTF